MKSAFILLLSLSVVFWESCQILKKPIPDKLVVLTFDDATASQYSVVAPLLNQFGFGATFFVCEFPSRTPDRQAYMDWQQIKELDKLGFEVANHTRTHIPASKVAEQQLIEELRYIEDKCNSLGIDHPTNFAYPGYDLSAPVLKILLKRGYRFARAGGKRPYDPLEDYPLLVPSWATNANNKDEIRAALAEAKDGKDGKALKTLHPDLNKTLRN